MPRPKEKNNASISTVKPSKKIVLDTKYRRITVYSRTKAMPYMARLLDFRGRGAKEKAEKVAELLLDEGAIAVEIKLSKRTKHYTIFAGFPKGEMQRIQQRAKSRFKQWGKNTKAGK